jgi:RNA-directed DNA polymerase
MTPRYLKRLSTLENLAALPNLLAASQRAMKGKRRRPDVQAWAMREEAEVLALREELLGGNWRPGGYRMFTIFEPKRRVVAAAPFRDRVVHHALCEVMQPLLERSFIARSFSCQVGKGTTAARECCRKLVNQHLYVLKCDVSKFFHQIDHEILHAKLAERIRCEKVLEVIQRILGSHETGDTVPMNLFAGDDLITAGERKRGLPIGNLTSQLWGNFYLDGLDHRITEGEAHGAYLRYTDDFLLFGNDKARLWELWAVVKEELAELRLRLAEPKSRMLSCAEGVPFCGFRFLPGLGPRILGATKRRFEARRNRIFQAGMRGAELTKRIFAWYQFSREASTEGLRRAYSQWPLSSRLRRRRGRNRVLRGGSWNNDNRDNLASSNRNNNTPDNRNNNNGFRVVVVR